MRQRLLRTLADFLEMEIIPVSGNARHVTLRMCPPPKGQQGCLASHVRQALAQPVPRAGSPDPAISHRCATSLIFHDGEIASNVCDFHMRGRETTGNYIGRTGQGWPS